MRYQTTGNRPRHMLSLRALLQAKEDYVLRHAELIVALLHQSVQPEIDVARL